MSFLRTSRRGSAVVLRSVPYTESNSMAEGAAAVEALEEAARNDVVQSNRVQV